MADADAATKCKRETELKWNGWGYRDSFFFVNDKNNVEFNGQKRYDISGAVLPHLKAWMNQTMGIQLDHKTNSQNSPMFDESTAAPRNETFISLLNQYEIPHSFDVQQRINRAHGHTLQDIFALRHGKLERIPDMVVWPRNHREVCQIISAANDHDVVIIPIGGGTSVSSALTCPVQEHRMIVSLDMCKMSRLMWIDRNNLVARAEAGIVGIDLEQLLNKEGFTMGHEPDSVEFSTLGGWVATRASGMKKNKYGNIEDLLVHVTMATVRGVVEKSCQVPRISSGPDVHHFVLGSEGTLGVVTEVTFKICPMPECKRYGSVLFPNFESGVKCMAEVARQKCAPASIRLMDNEQFVFGQALKPEAASYWKAFSDKLKKLYITKWKGFKVDDICAMTLVFERANDVVDTQEKKIYDIASKFGGIPAGAENGRYGYMLTYAIAYLRDLGFEYSCLGESFETSVPWDRVLTLCTNVKQLLHKESRRRGVVYPVYASCRVTQVYDSGACIYFYYAFNYRNMKDPLHIYEEIEELARDEVLACGGSISHHHGVGKLRKRWLPQTIGHVGMSALRALKDQLDPKNVFANGNLFDPVAKL